MCASGFTCIAFIGARSIITPPSATVEKVGLAADNLIGVELVTADGRGLDVTDKTYPDLML